MTRSEKHLKKTSKFVKAYSIYLAVIVAALIALFFYVRTQMIAFERNSPENYALWLVQNASDKSPLGEYLNEVNFSDNRYSSGDARKDDFYATVSSAELTAAASKGAHDSLHPCYDILADGKPFVTIELNEIGRKTKLGILTLSDWEISKAICRNPYDESGLKIPEDGKLNFKLVVPEGFKLEIDGSEVDLSNAEKTDLKDFEMITQFVKVPKGLIYNIENTGYEPSFVAYNNAGEQVILEKDINGSYIAKPEFAASDEAREFLLKTCDPLLIGKTWSKFMTDDIEGDAHGFGYVTGVCRLLYDTNIYKMAYSWAHNVDITFVSKHTLVGFSNESVSNFIKYNDNLYSCDVYFEKNMRVNGPQTDVFSNRMFFGAAHGTWYLMDMVAIEP